jgi:hypothetical protein
MYSPTRTHRIQVTEDRGLTGHMYVGRITLYLCRQLTGHIIIPRRTHRNQDTKQSLETYTYNSI